MLESRQPLPEGLTVDALVRGPELLIGKRHDGLFTHWVFPPHLLDNGVIIVVSEIIRLEVLTCLAALRAHKEVRCFPQLGLILGLP